MKTNPLVKSCNTSKKRHKSLLKKALIILVVLLLLPVLYFFVSDIYFKGLTDNAKINYLKDNSVSIDVNSFNLPADFFRFS